jgi:hypothetical protein
MIRLALVSSIINHNLFPRHQHSTMDLHGTGNCFVPCCKHVQSCQLR